jgi:hypothetical protein
MGGNNFSAADGESSIDVKQTVFRKIIALLSIESGDDHRQIMAQDEKKKC